MRLLIISASSCLLVLMFSFAALAQGGTGVITGVVSDPDPGALKKPWKTKSVSTLAANKPEIGEYICNENNQDVEHLIGK